MRPLTIIFLLIFSNACCQEPNQHHHPKQVEINDYIKNIIKLHDIPGLGVAVIKGGSVLHRSYHGSLSLNQEALVDSNTVFKLYSISKTIVATAVFQLIEDNKLSLNDSLDQYFENLPVLWQKVKIANLLSHSSGLPDIRNLTEQLNDDLITDGELIGLLYDDDMQFTTSELWSYNQTNYIFLKMLIEKQSGISFEQFIKEGQFPNSTTEALFVQSPPSSTKNNIASYYQFNKDSNKYEIKSEFTGKKNLPLAGINLTLDQYIQWNKRLDNNELLNATTKEMMWTNFDFKKSDREFLYGWDVYSLNGEKSYGFSGGGVSGFRKFLDHDISIIVLATGHKYYSIHNQVIDHIAGMIDTNLQDAIALITEQAMTDHFLMDSELEIRSIVTSIKNKNSGIHLEEVFNSIGFTLFFDLDRSSDAVELFKINVEDYPKSYDAHGSLAYLYFLSEQYVLARKEYQIALDLNPANSYSKRRIAQIDQILEEMKEKK